MTPETFARVTLDTYGGMAQSFEPVPMTFSQPIVHAPSQQPSGLSLFVDAV
jgi:hypothetical protein